MIIAISSKGDRLKSEFDPRFGRCEYFTIYNSGEKKISCVENQGKKESGGAGTGAAQQVFNEKADVIITGNLGGNAFKAVSVSGMRAYRGLAGKNIEELIQMYLSDELESIENPSSKKFK